MTYSVEHSFLVYYPLLWTMFCFWDEFQSETVGVVIVLQRVLESQEFYGIFFDNIKIMHEIAMIVLKFSLVFNFLSLYLLLKFFDQHLDLKLQLHF